MTRPASPKVVIPVRTIQGDAWTGSSSRGGTAVHRQQDETTMPPDGKKQRNCSQSTALDRQKNGTRQSVNDLADLGSHISKAKRLQPIRDKKILPTTETDS